jgi:hypothetical protein
VLFPFLLENLLDFLVFPSSSLSHKPSSYVLGSLLLNSVSTFIAVTVSGAIDFWIVKNLTGRMLIKLRWWTETDEEGHEQWIYECSEKEETLNPTDKQIFWWSQSIYTLFWGVLLIVNAISISFFWVENVLCLVLLNFVA